MEALRAAMAHARSKISGFLRWWSDALADTLPVFIRDWLARSPDGLVVEWHGDMVGIARRHHGRLHEATTVPVDLATELIVRRRRAGGGRRIILRIPPAQVLTKEVHLPLAVAGNVADALALDLDRLAPFPAGSACYFYREQDHDREYGRIRIILAIVASSMVARFARLARHCDLEFSAEDVELVGLGGMSLLDGAGILRGPTRACGLIRVTRGLAAILAVLMLLALAQRYRELTVIEGNALAASAKAGVDNEAILALRDQIRAAIDDRNRVLARKSRHPPLAEVIDELSAVLPDGAWLDELAVDGTQLRLRGRASEAEALVGLVEASPLLAQARFEAPVIPDPAGGYQFVLSATLQER